jgi:hypothetical protein
MGNADGRAMRDSSGLQTAAPVWNRIMRAIYAAEELAQSLWVNGAPPPTEFADPGGVEEREVCLPRGTGGARCTASRTDLFVVGAPVHGISRLGYTPDAMSNPGAWTLVTHELTGEAAQRVPRPTLADGTQAPLPTSCVVNVLRASEGARLYLPVPPHYPDEVRARLWARGTGYVMAPSTVCTGPVAAYSGSSSSSSSGSSSSSPSGSSYRITSPTVGQRIQGTTPIVGTAQFDAAQVQYYKLEIGNGRSPTAWTTFGATHSQPVSNGVLEQLQAGALPAGDYVIRLVLVGQDGNFFGEPYYVPLSIGP